MMNSSKWFFLALFAVVSFGINLCCLEYVYAKDEMHEVDNHEEHGAGHDNEADREEGVVVLDEEAQSMIQLKTVMVEKMKLGGFLEIYGKIAKDTDNYFYISSDAEGIVETIHVSLGDIVDEDVPLLTIRKTDGSQDVISSKAHGTVLSIFVKPGERFDKLTSLLSLVNVDTVRATFDIYERNLRLVAVGQKVIAKTSAFPDEKFLGKVVYISPQVDDHTQSIKIRVDIDNRGHLLKLGMFLVGDLIFSSDQAVLAVPTSAIQELHGEDVVFVAVGDEQFKPQDVILGKKLDDYAEVKEGLREGDQVVTKGSFYLKSELAKESFGDGHGH